MPQNDSLIGSADVCAELNIQRSQLSRWVADGRLTPVMRLPGKTGAMLFDPADVARMKEARAIYKGEDVPA